MSRPESYKKLEQKDMLAIAKLNEQGHNDQDIAVITGFPRRSVSHFLQRKNKNTQDFWALWDNSSAAIVEEAIEKKPRIFIYDIETSPMLGYFWGLFKQNIGLNQIKEDWQVLTWAGKWFGEDEILSDSCWNHGYDPDNKQASERFVIESLWAKFEEADMIVAHNGNRFDIKKVTARAVQYGIAPHSPVKKIDTMLIAKGVGMFTSNKLDYLAQHLCGVGKIDTGGFSLWTGCLDGDEESWNKMLTYNIGDVNILENVWVALAPYDKRSPSFIVHTDSEVTRCLSAACGSTDLSETGSTVKTSVSEFVGYKCNACGHQSRGRVSIRSKEQRDATLMNSL